jgi:hypothetical protein
VILIVSNRGDTAKVKDYKRRPGLVEVPRHILRELGKRRNFDPPDYWTHALDGETKVALRGVA